MLFEIICNPQNSVTDSITMISGEVEEQPCGTQLQVEQLQEDAGRFQWNAGLNRAIEDEYEVNAEMDALEQEQICVEEEMEVVRATMAQEGEEKRQLEAHLKAEMYRVAALEKENDMLKKLGEEARGRVKDVDAVALDLENELSQAELDLERLRASESTKAQKIQEVEVELEMLRSEVVAKEWRIEDLVMQVEDLREIVAERQRRMYDLEKVNASLEAALQESEEKYHEVLKINAESLHAMKSKISMLKEAADLSRQSSTVTNMSGVDGRLPMQPDEMIKRDSVMADIVDPLAPGTSEESVELKYQVEEQKKAVDDLETRITDLEKEYSDAKVHVRKLEEENAELRSKLESAVSEKQLVKASLDKITAASSRRLERIEKDYIARLRHAELSAQKAMHEMEEEHAYKMGRALASALQSQHEELEAAFTERVQAHERESQQLIAKLQEDRNRLSAENAAAMDELAHNKSDMERKDEETAVLKKERAALMDMLGELKEALRKSEENRKLEKENDAVQAVAKSKQATLRGTPLRVLTNQY